MVDEQHAVQMVAFVLHDDGRKIRQLLVDLVPIEVLRLQAHALVTRHVGPVVERNGKAALLLAGHLFPFQGKTGIDDHARAAFLLLRAVIHDQHTDIAPHLRRGQPHAGSGVHGFHHIGGKLPDFRRYFLDRLTFQLETGIRVRNYFKDHGDSLSKVGCPDQCKGLRVRQTWPHPARRAAKNIGQSCTASHKNRFFRYRRFTEADTRGGQVSVA